MKIGFIGAGRMGYTLGKHICESKPEGYSVSGYFSRHADSAKEAARFTDTLYYDKISDLVLDSDIIFVTVPDGQIAVIVGELDRLGDVVKGKIICHTSGALSSLVFSGMKQPIYGYSIHPIYAVNSKTESYINFSDCFITIEGHERYRQQLVELFVCLGHSVKIIDADNKVKYHGACVFASNLVIGLYRMAMELLEDCGLSGEEAQLALSTLFYNNATNLVKEGCSKALTGPVARCDIDTVVKHMDAFDKDIGIVYGLLSKELVTIARDNACKGKDNKEEINKKYDRMLEIIEKKIK